MWARLRLWAAGFAVAVTLPAQAAEISSAEYFEPTPRYDHGILGDTIEWGALAIVSEGRRYVIRLPETRVFEDLAPRILPGKMAVAAVETDLARGARLSVYGVEGLIAATPYIGRTHRWLAPVGAADLDGDGVLEIAYVDRPHLAKVLRIWRFEDGKLTHLADLPGLTNHRIGWDHIPGGVRECGGGPEIITADAGWQHVVATRWDGAKAVSRQLGRYTGPESLNRVLDCD